MIWFGIEHSCDMYRGYRSIASALIRKDYPPCVATVVDNGKSRPLDETEDRLLKSEINMLMRQ